MMLSTEDLLGGIILPATVSLLALLITARWERTRTQVLLQMGGAFALGGGFLSGYAALGFAPLQPTESWHWLPYAALIAGLVGLVECLPSLTLIWSGRLLAAIILSERLVPNWPSLAGTRLYWIAGLSGIILLEWSVLSPVLRRVPGALLPVSLVVISAAAAILLVLAAIASFAQLAGVICAILGSAVLVGWLFPQRDVLSGMLPGLATLLPGLLLNGHLLGGTAPVSAMVLVALSPLLLSLSVVPTIRRLSMRWRILLQGTAVLIPIAIALFLAAPSSLEDW